MDTHLRGGKIKRSKDSGWTPVFTGERFSCIFSPRRRGSSVFLSPRRRGPISPTLRIFLYSKRCGNPSLPFPHPEASSSILLLRFREALRSGPGFGGRRRFGMDPSRHGGTGERKEENHSLLFSCVNAKLTTSIIIKKKKFYTLNITTSPSCIIYSFPSVRTFPTSFAFDQEDASKSSSHPITSALIKRSLKSL